MTTLNSQVDNWTKRYKTAGVDGLTLMVNVVGHMAAHRDWDAAARLLGKVDETTRLMFARIIRARFGDTTGADGKNRPTVKAKKDDKHSTGYRIVLGFDGTDPAFTNATTATWKIVLDAVARKATFFDRTMHKALREAFKNDDEDTEAKAYDYAAAAKRAATRLTNEDASLVLYIAALQALVKKTPQTKLVNPAPKAPEGVVELLTAAS